jgi:flagellar biosynthetic protein FliS
MLAAYERYQHTKISTADPKALVVMLFDRTLLACRKARDAAACGDFSTKGKETNRAQAILQELSLGLNHEAAPELSQNLARLYQFWSTQVTQWHLGRRSNGLEVVERQVRELREAFARAFGMRRADEDSSAA